MEVVKKRRNVLFLVALLPVLFAACGTFERPRIPGPVPIREITPTLTHTPTSRATPTEVATPTHIATPVPVKLPEKCEEVINDVKLTDLLKHRQLFSIALQLEFKGRNDEAVVVLREALKFKPDNELARMKLDQLMRKAGRLEEVEPETEAREEAAPVPEKEGEEVRVEEVPPGLELSDGYLDIVNSMKLSSCAKGYKLFVLGSKLESGGKIKEALFLYRKAVSLCPDEAGPNATINRQALVKIVVLEKAVTDKDIENSKEGSGPNNQ